MMKGKKWIACLLTALTSLAAAAQETEQVGTLDLTLPRAIEIALAENPTIRVADKDVELRTRKHGWPYCPK